MTLFVITSMQTLTFLFSMTTIRCSFIIVIVIFGVVVYSSNLKTNEKESRCLKECLKPILKFERSFTFQFTNFEKICDKLESAAFCNQKCSPADQHRFYQYTSFYRLHCIDFYEEFESQLKCLKNASSDVDKTCNERCTFNASNQENKIKTHCKTLKCSLICYYEVFSSACPKTQDILLRLSIRLINDLRLFIPPNSLSNMETECHQLHDEKRMKQEILEVKEIIGWNLKENYSNKIKNN